MSTQQQETYFKGQNLEFSWRYAFKPETLPLLFNYLGAKPGQEILEVGAGTGFLARLIAKNLEDVNIVGLEKQEDTLEIGHLMVQTENLSSKVALRLGDATQIPYPNNAFDMVTSLDLL